MRIPLYQHYCWVCSASWAEEEPDKTDKSDRKDWGGTVNTRKPKRRKTEEGVKMKSKKKA